MIPDTERKYIEDVLYGIEDGEIFNVGQLTDVQIHALKTYTPHLFRALTNYGNAAMDLDVMTTHLQGKIL